MRVNLVAIGASDRALLSRFGVRKLIVEMMAVLCLISASTCFGAFVDFSTPALAIQKVDLFTGTPFHVNATLSASGTID